MPRLKTKGQKTLQSLRARGRNAEARREENTKFCARGSRRRGILLRRRDPRDSRGTANRANKQWGASSSYRHRGVSAKPVAARGIALVFGKLKCGHAVDATPRAMGEPGRAFAPFPIYSLGVKLRERSRVVSVIIFDKLVHSTCPYRRNKKS